MGTTDKASEGFVKIKIKLGSWAVSSATFNPACGFLSSRSTWSVE